MPDTYTKARWKEKGTSNIVHPETEVDQLKATGGNALASIINLLLKAATTEAARSAIEAAAASHTHTTSDITDFSGGGASAGADIVQALGEETLAALGVQYSITTNGYICFGELFGGLILQWRSGFNVTVSGNGSPIYQTSVTWPISFNNTNYSFAMGLGTNNGYNIAAKTKTTYTMRFMVGVQTNNCAAIAIGW